MAAGDLRMPFVGCRCVRFRTREVSRFWAGITFRGESGRAAHFLNVSYAISTYQEWIREDTGMPVSIVPVPLTWSRTISSARATYGQTHFEYSNPSELYFAPGEPPGPPGLEAMQEPGTYVWRLTNDGGFNWGLVSFTPGSHFDISFSGLRIVFANAVIGGQLVRLRPSGSGPDGGFLRTTTRYSSEFSPSDFAALLQSDLEASSCFVPLPYVPGVGVGFPEETRDYQPFITECFERDDAFPGLFGDERHALRNLVPSTLFGLMFDGYGYARKTTIYVPGDHSYTDGSDCANFSIPCEGPAYELLPSATDGDAWTRRTVEITGRLWRQDEVCPP